MGLRGGLGNGVRPAVCMAERRKQGGNPAGKARGLDPACAGLAGGPVAQPPLARVGAGLWPDRFQMLRRARLGVCFQGCGARAWGEAAKAARDIYKALRAATASDFEILSPKRGFLEVATRL